MSGGRRQEDGEQVTPLPSVQHSFRDLDPILSLALWVYCTAAWLVALRPCDPLAGSRLRSNRVTSIIQRIDHI